MHFFIALAALAAVTVVRADDRVPFPGEYDPKLTILMPGGAKSVTLDGLAKIEKFLALPKNSNGQFGPDEVESKKKVEAREKGLMNNVRTCKGYNLKGTSQYSE